MDQAVTESIGIGEASLYHPASASMGLAAATLLQRTVTQFPPPARTIVTGGARLGAQPLGCYLLEVGYITPEQLAAALVAQRHARKLAAGGRLGELLVERRIISEKVLATMLLLQSIEHSFDIRARAPRFIGEYMLLTRQITPEQFALALEIQTKLSLRGKHVLFGDVLVGMRIITPDQRLALLETFQRIWAHPAQPGYSIMEL